MAEHTTPAAEYQGKHRAPDDDAAGNVVDLAARLGHEQAARTVEVLGLDGKDDAA